MTNKRVMIIVWKWKDLMKEKKNWDEAKIIDQNNDKIIRIIEPNSTEAKDRLYRFVQENHDANVFIFLHRGHNYKSNDVKEVLHRIHENGYNGNLVKAFLFQGPRDFIYYSTQNEGLLNQTGQFARNDVFKFRERASNGEEIVKTERVTVANFNLDSRQWEVIPKHFNRVWRHYEHEFKKKINSLHLDLMSYLVEIPSNHSNKKPFPIKLWYNQIKERETPLLYIRLKSFFDAYTPSSMEKLNAEEWKIAKDELNILKEWEKLKQVSTSFDDCNANLSENEEARDHYSKLKENFDPNLLKTNPNKKISLYELHHLFKSLVKILPD